MKTNFKALSKVTSKLSRSTGKLRLAVKKHAPEILLVTGTVSIIAGGVSACKSTLKAQEVIAKKNEELETIREAREISVPEEYSDADYKKDLLGSYGRFGLSMAKLYAPAIVLTGLGVFSIFASNNIMRKRCASLSAAYVTLDQAFKKYRQGVVEKYGEEVDKELRYGIHKEKIETTEVDENGKEKKSKKNVDLIGDNNCSPYARFFDENSDCFQTDSSGRPATDYNLFFLKAREKEANTRLETQGYLFLNDVYKMLGISPSLAGQSVGWIYDKEKAHKGLEQDGDGFVSFGIEKATRANARFIEGIEDVILLDFNVDGPILENLNGVLARI